MPSPMAASTLSPNSRPFSAFTEWNCSMLMTMASMLQFGWYWCIRLTYSKKKFRLYSPVRLSNSAAWISLRPSFSSMMRPTRASMTSCMSKGLVIKSAAPISSALSSAFRSAVSTMMGMTFRSSSLRTHSSTLNPSISGMIKSSSTTERLSRYSSIICSASLPLVANMIS